MTASQQDLGVVVDCGTGDHDTFAHYVDAVDAMIGLTEGVMVMALCGKIWVPSKDPDKYPICPTCLEVYAHIVGA